jgi:predicted amidophosphoribosyltransferase
MPNWTKEGLLRLLDDLFNPNKQCSVCDNPRCLWERFCKCCGTPNHHFDLAALNREYGGPNGTIEEAMKNGCPHWHTKELDYPEFNFCPICGFEMK